MPLRISQVFLSVCLVPFLFVSCSSTKHAGVKRIPGTWQAGPITIDGSNKDWPSPFPEYDEKAQLGYAVSNDKDNLYITVETGDPATQLKILRNGLTVWIDKTGEKNEETAINYPIPGETAEEGRQDGKRPSQGEWQGSGQDKRRMELEDRVRKAIAGANEFSLQGFKGCNMQFQLMEKDSCGIMVRMNLDADNELVWEAVVPFKAFYSKQEIDKRDKGKPISICFETVGIKKPAGQGGGGGYGGGGGMRPGMGIGVGGMGMRMGGGGMRGGNRGGGQGQASNMMEPAYKSTKTWKRTGIAFQ
jgi:hypothetical protein